MHPENQLTVLRDLQRFCAIHDQEELRQQLWAWLMEAFLPGTFVTKALKPMEMARLLEMVYEMTASVT